MAKTIVVTGASSGIGLELCKQLMARGDMVYGTCRKPNDNMKAVGMNIVEGIDVTDDNVGSALAKALTGVKIDVLVNNAGGFTTKESKETQGIAAMEKQKLASLDLEEMRYNFEVNTLGPLKVSKSLVDQVNTPGKIAIITSLMGSIGDAGGDFYAYRTSKAGVNMIGKAMSADLKGKGISVGLIHPGMIQTQFAGDVDKVPEQMRKMQRSVEDGVKGVIQAIDEMNLENTGTFWHANYGDGLKTCPW